MKRFYTLLLLCAGAAGALRAQTTMLDTVFFQTFDEDLEPIWITFPTGNDTTYVNLDEDGLEPSGGADAEFQWYQTVDFAQPDDTTIATNYVLASKSWMEGFLPGNRNWFILPPITVEDNSYVLSWKSAPLQLPRYVDGYLVLVSTTTNNAYESPSPFTDTLFEAAQMVEITGTGGSLDTSNFLFSPGYIHGLDSLGNWDWDYVELFTEGDSTLLRGRLEPHTASLEAYAGQTIYIAFLHNSDDDNLISIDDILVTRGNAVGTHEAALRALDLRTFPNPATEALHVRFELTQSQPITLQITDAAGRTVATVDGGTRPAGEHLVRLDVRTLPAGVYALTLRAGAVTVGRGFVKR